MMQCCHLWNEHLVVKDYVCCQNITIVSNLGYKYINILTAVLLISGSVCVCVCVCFCKFMSSYLFVPVCMPEGLPQDNSSKQFDHNYVLFKITLLIS